MEQKQPELQSPSLGGSVQIHQPQALSLPNGEVVVHLADVEMAPMVAPNPTNGGTYTLSMIISNSCILHLSVRNGYVCVYWLGAHAQGAQGNEMRPCALQCASLVLPQQMNNKS
jgi:hypothetical protein